MEPLVLVVLVVAAVLVAVGLKVRQMRRDAHDLMRRGHALARNTSRTPAQDLELADISRRLVKSSGPLLDYRLEPLIRLRWLPANIYQLVTTGLDGSEDPSELEDFALVVAVVHLGGGSGSVSIWSDQALRFAQGHYDAYYATERAGGSDDTTADRVARERAGALAMHYFPFAIQKTASG